MGNAANALFSLPASVAPYQFRYMVLRDKTPEEIIAAAEKHKDTFIYTFLTKGVDDCLDYNPLNEVPAPMSHFIVKPIYIGNFTKESQETVMQEIIKRAGIEEYEEISA